MNEEDQIPKLYMKYKETIHVIGFLVLCIFTLGGTWTKWQAWAADVDELKSRTTKLEYTNGQILQNLQDIKEFLHVPHHY